MFRATTVEPQTINSTRSPGAKAPVDNGAQLTAESGPKPVPKIDSLITSPVQEQKGEPTKSSSLWTKADQLRDRFKNVRARATRNYQSTYKMDSVAEPDGTGKKGTTTSNGNEARETLHSGLLGGGYGQSCHTPFYCLK